MPHWHVLLCYNRWPWIFIVEGVITIAYGLVVIFFLPPTPARARFLNLREKLPCIGWDLTFMGQTKP